VDVVDAMLDFEFPAPRLKISVPDIDIETAGGFEGSFTVTNTGGGKLRGEIHVNSPCVVFYPCEFIGNNVEVNYSLNLASYKAGDVFTASAFVSSNGGEMVIPIVIKIVLPMIYIKEDRGLTSLEDFYEYAEQSPIMEWQLFNQWEFADWLVGQGYAHMELYERIVKDPNKERAVDNFLIISGIKEKCVIKVDRKFAVIKVNPTQNDSVAGEISFRRLSAGYAEVRLSTDETSWLKLDKEVLYSSDFQSDGSAVVKYSVDTAALNAKPDVRVHRAEIAAETDNGYFENVSVYIIVRRAFTARLSKTRYTAEDEGFIEVINNTGGDTMLEVVCNEKAVKLSGKKYLVAKRAEIPFRIKASNGMAFWKAHSLETLITIQKISGVGCRQQLRLRIDS